MEENDLEQGSSLAQKDKEGRDALEIALVGGNPHLVDLLLSLGADPTVDAKLQRKLKAAVSKGKAAATTAASRTPSVTSRQIYKPVTLVSSCIRVVITCHALLTRATTLLHVDLKIRLYNTLLQSPAVTESSLSLFLDATATKLHFPASCALKWTPTLWRKLTVLCPKVEQFSLVNCTLFNGESLRILVNGWPELQLLHLRGCQEVMGSSAGAIIKLTKIQSLDLSETSIDNSVLTAFAETDFALKELRLSGLRITASGVKPLLLSNPDITRLSLAETLVDNSIFASLAKLAKLSVLDLSNCAKLTDDAVLAYVSQYAHPIELTFSWTSNEKRDTYRSRTV